MEHGRERDLPIFTSRKVQWAVVVALLALMYKGVLPRWGVDLWNDPNYSHGLLIPFLSLYLFKEKWDELIAEERGTCWWGLLPVLFAVTVFVAGQVGAEFFSKRISLIFLLYGSILLLEGRRVAAVLAFPVVVLFFAVPLPYVIYNAAAFPLKLIASKIAVWLIALLGMPVFREGNVISLPHTTMEVVDACSGIRSLMTLFTLAFLVAYFHHKRLWKRGLVFLLAAPVAVIANAIRVTMTGVLTKYDPAWGEGVRHDITGWLVFVISFVLLVVCSSLLKGKKTNE